MAQIETLGLLEEIQSLVSDQLQVGIQRKLTHVSYKWLSRNFLVSSNAAKRLLKEFVEKHGGGLEVVYSLSGWLKNRPSTYCIRLVSGSKLAEAEQGFDAKCSVQVYSVQASIPNDPAALWNAEFVQAEELFKQPSDVDNCLRDNRFCGVFNSFVKRNVERTQVSILATQTKSLGVLGLSKGTSSHQENAAPSHEPKKFQQSSRKIGVQSLNGSKEVKSENIAPAVNYQSSTSSANKEKFPPVPANKEKVQDEKTLSGTGGSLANLWGRASGKSKHNAAPVDDKNDMPDPSEARISSGVDQNDGDEPQDLNIKRASKGDSRKRKVVFDLSDEEYEDAISLASPGAPKEKSHLDGKQSPKHSVSDRSNPISGKIKKNEAKVKEEKHKEESDRSLGEDSSFISKKVNANVSSSKKIGTHASEAGANLKGKVNEAPTSPKRRKVLKTRIDERGREVTEVVWEGEENTKKVENDSEKKEDSGTTKKTEGAAVNRPLGPKKSPATGNTAAANAGGKAGNKKGANAKDPKQGNILSFFKKV